MEPRWITADTDVIIKGRGFSADTCHNSVKLGTHACDVISSTESQITCRINTTNGPPVNTLLKVSVHVHNRGKALINAGSTVNETLKVRAIISSFSPVEGSIAGGTRVVIKGFGFTGAKAVVSVGVIECKITSTSYTEIRCTTGKLSSLAANTWPIRVHINDDQATCNQTDNNNATAYDCMYSYVTPKTAVVRDIPDRQIGQPTKEITVNGSGFGTDAAAVAVSIGPTSCNITSMNDSLILCNVHGISAGSHKLHVYVHPHGDAWFSTSDTITGVPAITSVSPTKGSIHGGNEITITGNGFDPTYQRVTATLNGKTCAIKSVTFSSVVCVTPPGSGDHRVVVKSNSVTFPTTNSKYTFDASVTPTVGTLSITKGHGGQSITISGSSLNAVPSSRRRRRSIGANQVQVNFGTEPCNVTSVSNNSIQCTVPPHAAGSVPVKVNVQGKGHSNSDVTFEYELVLTSIAPSESGYGGGRNVTLSGYGYSANDTVTICNNTCKVLTSTITDTQLTCESPEYKTASYSTDNACDIIIRSSSGASKSLPNAYTYRSALTSRITSVSPRRGGTGGGVRLTITGTALHSGSGPSVVTIAGNPCAVQSSNSTVIVCITASSSETVRTQVRVDVGQNGKAVASNKSSDFFYVDVWSSKFSWGGKDPPVKGKFLNLTQFLMVLKSFR